MCFQATSYVKKALQDIQTREGGATNLNLDVYL